MASFPFVVQPRLKPIIEKIGSEEAGYIECKRQGYLTVGEKAGVKQVVSAYDATSDVLGLSKRVAGSYKIDLQEAYEIVASAVTGQVEDPRVMEVSETYQEEIGSLMSKMTQSAVFSELAKAFVLILYRVEGASEITMDNVSELHPDLLVGLAALYDEEESKTTERLLEDGNGRDIAQVEKAGKK
jgi:hypothetical protein